MFFCIDAPEVWFVVRLVQWGM